MIENRFGDCFRKISQTGHTYSLLFRAIPVTKWSGTFSLVLFYSDCVKKPRRSLGFAYVFRLVRAENDVAIIFPNHLVPGIAAAKLQVLNTQAGKRCKIKTAKLARA